MRTDFQPPKSLQGAEIAILCVMPGCPCVAAIVGVEVSNLGALAGAAERGRDTAAGGRIGIVVCVRSLVSRAIRAAKDFLVTMRQVGKFGYHARMQWHAPRLAVLGFRERDMPPRKIEMVPVEPQRLANARAGIEQDDHKGRVGRQMAAERGLTYAPSGPGEHVTGRLAGVANLASGRFAMIEDGLGFQLVPWQPGLGKHLDQYIGGVRRDDGGIE